MIAIDTSALAAIAFREPEAADLARLLARYPGEMLLGAPTRLELSIVVTNRLGDAAARRTFAEIVPDRVSIIPFDAQHAAAAQDAFDRFGKGRHPAGLNFGDCMAYAVARVAGCPLLYKGADFARTDVRAAA